MIKNKIYYGIVFVLVVFFVTGLFAKTKKLFIVDDSVQFANQIIMFSEKYMEEENIVKQDDIFHAARKYEKEFFKKNRKVKNWKGDIFHMGRQEGGNGICLMVHLYSHIDTTTNIILSQGCNGSYMNVDSHSIKRGSKVYKQLGEFGEVWDIDCVMFSGVINPKESNGDSQYEAMLRPAYDFKFTNIKLCPPSLDSSSDSDSN